MSISIILLVLVVLAVLILPPFPFKAKHITNLSQFVRNWKLVFVNDLCLVKVINLRDILENIITMAIKMMASSHSLERPGAEFTFSLHLVYIKFIDCSVSLWYNIITVKNEREKEK